MATYPRSQGSGEQDADIDDPALRSLLDAARHDPETLGVLLHGSRGARMADDQSDYDLLWVLTDAGYRRRDAIGGCAPQVTMREGHKHSEVAYSSPALLQGAASLG